MKKYLAWLCLILAFANGIFAGWVDPNNDAVQAAVLVILVVTFLLGMISSRRTWLWAIIVAFCLPGVYLIAHGLGYQPVSPPSPRWYASLIAFIPAFIGAYLVVLARLAINSLVSTSLSQNGR